MANEEEVSIIYQGIEAWNKWRNENRNKHKESLLSIEEFISSQKKINLSLTILPLNLIEVDFSDTDLQKSELSNANLTNANLTNADLRNAKLSNANLRGADLRFADLRGAHLSNADLTDTNLYGAHFSNADLTNTNFKNTDLRGASFDNAYFDKANLSGAILSNVNLLDASFCGAILTNANLIGADLQGADLTDANLQEADMSSADLYGAVINNANLEGAIFIEADLSRVDFAGANLSKANLSNANLKGATMVQTIVADTVFKNCAVYGFSAWDLIGVPKDQSNLIITPTREAIITVDDLKVAQFIYLLLNNENVRNVLDTLTSKTVLILGRFSDERKILLDAIRDELRNKYNLTPILFDFNKPDNKDITGTMETLARMARFIIANLTDPSSIPFELATIVPSLRSTPVIPIRLKGTGGFGMFTDYEKAYSWVLKVFEYKDNGFLIKNLPKIISLGNKKADALRKAGNNK